jgi:hypothetical protein
MATTTNQATLQAAMGSYLFTYPIADYIDTITGTMSQLPTAVQKEVISYLIVGKPASAGVFNRVMPYAVTVPANLAGTVVFDSVQATASAAFTVNKISAGVTTGVATITITTSSKTSCTLSTQAAFSLAAGDVLQILAPTQDATLQDINIAILATKV